MKLLTQLIAVLALTILAMIAVNRYALAFEIEYPERYDRERLRPQVKAWVQRHSKQPPRVITKTVIIPERAKPEPRCKPAVSALGDNAKSIEAAKLEGMKAVKAVIQHQYGNRYLDVDSTQEPVEFQCAPSSIPTFGGKVEDFVGRVLPIQSYACKVTVWPCEASVQREHVGK
jgi:hypothetical protein